MKPFLPFIILLFASSIFANDGAFKANGNHLIPVSETDISVKKEILTIKKIRDQYIEVTVYYEFFNPKQEKNLTVGFEAFSPTGDVDGMPRNGLHPYMRDFTVQVNDKLLQYKVAYVTDSAYVEKGKVVSKPLNETEIAENENYVNFFYVYHFEAKFKKGLNIVKHTYNYDLSSGIEYFYHFGYILTAAKRWANKRIDDFTLIIDMGEFETFMINKQFFNSSKEWLINGIGKAKDLETGEYPAADEAAVKFHIQKGNLVFQQKNFTPKGELVVFAEPFHSMPGNSIPFSYHQQDMIPVPSTVEQRKILRNLPYARRGMVFKKPAIQNYYETFDWYIPNPNYVPETKLLTDQEKEWIRKLGEDE
jgi:hypothetical protein